MVDLDLSDKERLILANQYEIMGMLEEIKNGQDARYYKRLSEWLRYGYKWFYEDRLQNLLSEKLDEEDAKSVLDILDLYRLLHAAVNSLEDKSDISEEDLIFEGFDGHHETALLGFAHALVQDHRFEESLGKPDKDGNPTKNLNSHREMMHCQYKKMLKIWEELGKPVPKQWKQFGAFEQRRPIEKKDILQILFWKNVQKT